MSITGFLTQSTDNRITRDYEQQIRKLASQIRQDRVKLRKQFQDGLVLILLAHRKGLDDSQICRLPLEILDYIIRQFLLPHMPSASFDLFI